jgi:hypothetical protein
VRKNIYLAERLLALQERVYALMLRHRIRDGRVSVNDKWGKIDNIMVCFVSLLDIFRLAIP